MTLFKYLPISILCVISGCAAERGQNSQPPIIMDVADETLQPFASAWQAEASRRFNDATVLLCHGSYTIDGEWLIYCRPGSDHPFDTVERVVAEEQHLYPGRTIILLACNVDHIALHGMPNVFYARSEVWCTPDRAVGMADQAAMTLDGVDDSNNSIDNRSTSDPDIVGNIYEFVEAR